MGCTARRRSVERRSGLPSLTLRFGVLRCASHTLLFRVEMGEVVDGRSFVFGERRGELLFERGMVGVDREVGPLVGVGVVVVELFAAVGVADVSPARRAEGVVAAAVGGEAGAGPGCIRVAQEGR